MSKSLSGSQIRRSRPQITEPQHQRARALGQASPRADPPCFCSRIRHAWWVSLADSLYPPDVLPPPDRHADFCRAEGIGFVLGHALYMKAIHGGKKKNDKLDAEKIARLAFGGNLPTAYVYPPLMRATRQGNSDPLTTTTTHRCEDAADGSWHPAPGTRPNLRVAPNRPARRPAAKCAA